jgi:GDP-D-mannose 3',5'-epimerase
VFESIRACGVDGLIYVGTACSFPAHLQTGPDARPLREDDLYPAAPESAYGWSKLMGQYEVDLLAQESGIPVSTLMLHNVYGTPTDYSERMGQVIPSLVRKAIRYPREPFVVWGSGSQGRAFVHVDDVVDALLSAATNGLGRGVIQIGPDVCTTIRELAETIVEVSGKEIEVQFDRAAPEGDGGRSADYAKAREALSWEPRVPLREGIANLYSWMSERLELEHDPDTTPVASGER